MKRGRQVIRIKITKNSIAVRTFVILLLVVFTQSGIFSLVSLGSGIFEETEKNSLDVFEDKVSNRSVYLENEMLTRFSNLSIYASEMVETIDQYLLKHDITIDTLATSPNHGAQLSILASESLIQILRSNQVSGAYFILGNQSDDDFTSNGLYLRDSDPRRNPNDISDIQCLRGNSMVSDELNIPLSTKWQPQYHFTRGSKNDEFYFKMQETMKSNPVIKDELLGYWNESTQVTGEDTNIITYTYPLRNEKKEVYGYLGIDCTSEYINRLMPNNEIGNRTSYVLLMKHHPDEKAEIVSIAGKTLTNDLDFALNVRQEQLGSGNLIIQNKQGEDIYGNSQPLALYRKGSPYQSEQWYLTGLVHGDEILYTRNKMQSINQLVTLVSIGLGIILVLIAVRVYSKPIRDLASDVKGINPSKPVKLSSTNIAELDELAFAIESLSRNVAESASSVSRILNLTSYPFCAFEYYKKTEQYFCSDGFEELLSLQEFKKTITSKRDLLEALCALNLYLDEEQNAFQTRIIQINHGSTALHRWLRMHAVEEENHVVGVIEDITDEMLKMKKIEYERDSDVLTNLLNRRAYNRIMHELFEKKEELKIGALIMSDLDNLKYINDTFGHDWGDDYIRLMAKTLLLHLPENAVISRVSGDEFFIFLYGYDKFEDLALIIEKFFVAINECVWQLPDGTVSRLRATSGIAVYPSDTDNFKELNKYADFTMYKMKHLQKGGHSYFKAEDYEDDAYLLQAKEDFNQMIDKQAVYYVYQPIVDVNTGEIFAYEALLRSNVVSLSSPLEILNIAKSQARLYDIEKLTFFKAMETFINQENKVGAKLFINSISNQCLNKEDLALFEIQYQKYLSQIVIEVTEEEKFDAFYTKFKRDTLEKWGAEIALDDYGNGYNGESALVETKPNYVKINQLIVHYLSSDHKRGELLRNIVSYAKNNQIKIIAEDVENYEELMLLKKYGIDYVQGFYVGTPERILMDIPETMKKIIKEA